jgi:tetratricopeptide (TPR) repeat protein
VSRIGFPSVCILTVAALALAAQEPGQNAAQTAPEADRPEPSRADLTEVYAAVREQRYADAERLAGELQQDHPDDPALLALRGELLLAIDRAPEAVAPLRRAAELAPDRPRVHFQLGTALASTGDAEGALGAFDAELSISKEPEVLVLSRLNRSLLFQRGGRPADAAQELEAALAIDPSRGPVYGDLATLYLELDRIDDATSTLSRGAEAGFRSARHWFTVGARLVRDERYEQSIDPLRRALEADPQLADAERTLAAALDHLGRGDEALGHFRRYVELAPSAADAPAVRSRIAELEK